MFVAKYSSSGAKEEVHDFLTKNGFGILVSYIDGKSFATHIPMMFDEKTQTLSGHVSRGNPHWKNFKDNSDVLAIFQGPHAYISSSWYDHENVPTWNYAAVHVYGKIRIIAGEELYRSLSQMVDKYEKASEKPVSVEKMSKEYFSREVKGLVGFEIKITEIEAGFKLSGNRDSKNYTAIVNELEKRNTGDDKAVAELMKKDRSKYKE